MELNRVEEVGVGGGALGRKLLEVKDLHGRVEVGVVLCVVCHFLAKSYRMCPFLDGRSHVVDFHGSGSTSFQMCLGAIMRSKVTCHVACWRRRRQTLLLTRCDM